MTIGIGGWGPRRKPMALVRAILRSDLKDLTLVSWGGADVGLLVRAGKVKSFVYAFVSLDTVPLEPNFQKARQEGAIPEVVELDEGMFQTGLRAAAQRLPFLPMRAGLGSDVLVNNPWIKTVESPYDDGEELVAVPALNLDEQGGPELLFALDPDAVGSRRGQPLRAPDDRAIRSRPRRRTRSCSRSLQRPSGREHRRRGRGAHDGARMAWPASAAARRTGRSTRCSASSRARWRAECGAVRAHLLVLLGPRQQGRRTATCRRRRATIRTATRARTTAVRPGRALAPHRRSPRRVRRPLRHDRRHPSQLTCSTGSDGATGSHERRKEHPARQQRVPTRASVAVLAVLAPISACGDEIRHDRVLDLDELIVDDDERAQVETLDDGRHFVFVKSLHTNRRRVRIEFDLARWFTGDAAISACTEEAGPTATRRRTTTTSATRPTGSGHCPLMSVRPCVVLDSHVLRDRPVVTGWARRPWLRVTGDGSRADWFCSPRRNGGHRRDRGAGTLAKPSAEQLVAELGRGVTSSWS